VLVRAAIVRTLTQIPEISYVAFTIQGEMLMDSAGNAVGPMAADTFIDNAGNEINAYEKVNLRLYFANEAGDSLVEENRRNVVYNSNIPLEKLVVEQLIEGPMAEGGYPTINPLTKLVSVNVKDGVCYVDLSEDFLSQPYNVNSEVTIYSITNSLVELSNVNKVQISVNGETNISYRENIKLSTVFERNLDLLDTDESREEQ
jgi:germination protein M